MMCINALFKNQNKHQLYSEIAEKGKNSQYSCLRSFTKFFSVFSVHSVLKKFLIFFIYSGVIASHEILSLHSVPKVHNVH